MNSSTAKPLIRCRLVIWLGLALIFVGCTTSEIPTATIPAGQAEVPITRAASTATVPGSPTPIPPTLTPTSLPTATLEPTRTPFPTRTPTPSPWLVEDFSPFLFYNDGLDIYLVRPNGERHFITEGRLWDGQPWSPDGLKFIYNPNPLLADIIGSAAIVDLSTGQTQSLDRDIYGYVFWSPDGKYLFYGKGDVNSSVELRLYDFDRQTSELLLEVPLDFASDKVLLAGWSPDSRQVAFIAQLNGQYDLYTMEVETLALQQLTSSPEPEVLATWSPVTNQLLVGTASSIYELHGHRPFRTEKFQLIDDTGAELAFLGPYEYLSTASWSPDGQRIAYSADEGLCILDVATLDSTCPLEDTILAGYVSASDYPAVWSADGKWLAFQSYDELLCYWLFLFDLSTNTVVDLEGPCSTRSYIHWSRAAP
jgi:dipeptidyl aminopeptidase/acylaminoacyl peptidase